MNCSHHLCQNNKNKTVVSGILIACPLINMTDVLRVTKKKNQSCTSRPSNDTKLFINWLEETDVCLQKGVHWAGQVSQYLFVNTTKLNMVVKNYRSRQTSWYILGVWLRKEMFQKIISIMLCAKWWINNNSIGWRWLVTIEQCN